MFEEFLKNNEKSVNNIVSKICKHLIIAPVAMLIGTLCGYFDINLIEIKAVFTSIVLLNIIQWLFRHYNIKSSWIKYFNMISIQLAITLCATDINIGIYLTYMLAPMFSSLYFDKKFTKNILFISYFMMLIGLYHRSFSIVSQLYTQSTEIQWFMSTSFGFTIEYIILSVVIYNFSIRARVFMENLISRNAKIKSIQEHIIFSFADLIESRDDETGKHVKRTSDYVKLIMDQLIIKGPYSLEITNELYQNICLAAPLHDIGKIKISDGILCKPGKLTSQEFEIIKTHTTSGNEIINKVLAFQEPSFIKTACEIALYHHEKWNGSGYPYGLKENEIPLCARIMAVADVFDALVSKRVYKNAMTIEEAMNIIVEGRGNHFDPYLVDIFSSLKEDVIKIVEQEI